MSRKFYCSNCGQQLTITRKAIPKAGAIIDVVQFHECSAEMKILDIDLSHPIVAEPVSGKDGFEKSLKEIKVDRNPGMVSTANLRDRRFEKDEVKSTAPQSVQDMIGKMIPTTPAHPINAEGEPESEG